MKRSLAISLFLCLTILSCSKESIQDVAVYYTVHLYDTKMKNLLSTGGCVTIKDQGVAGLIIRRRGDGSYAAFDQCSTVEPAKRCAVEPIENGTLAEDPCSGARFYLDDGSAAKEPAVHPLKQYKVYSDGAILRVFN